MSNKLENNMKINGKKIDSTSPCYIIAEMSANHGGSLEKAKEIIREAKQSGADAIKLQTYTADTITLDSDKPDFCLPSDNPWQSHVSLHSLYQKAYTLGSGIKNYLLKQLLSWVMLVLNPLTFLQLIF